MQKLLLPPLVLALLFLVPAAAPPRQEADDETKLALVMERIRTETKSIGKALEAKDAEGAWTAVCALQSRLLEAKLETPATAASLPVAERPAYVNTFRSRISSALKTSCDLEMAVLTGRFEFADQALKEITGPMQKAGHREFRKD